MAEYNSLESSSLESLSPDFSNVADRFSKNSAFHLEIITGFTSNFLDNSASVCWFFTASNATLALKVGLNYPAIMKAIVDTGYKGYVAQEFIPTWDDKIAALKQGVQICDV
jgi:hypothetical protein